MFNRFPWLKAVLRPSTVDFAALAADPRFASARRRPAPIAVTRLSARDVELVEAALDAPAEPNPALRRWVAGLKAPVSHDGAGQ